MRKPGARRSAFGLMLEYTGLSLEEVQTGGFRALFPDDVETARHERQKGLERGASFQLELWTRRKDGRCRWFLVHYRPLRDEQGHIVRWVCDGDRHRRPQAGRRESPKRESGIARRDRSLLDVRGDFGILRSARVLAQVAKVAPTESTVLISGETGTDKELIARAIHRRSSRSTRAFIRVKLCGHSVFADRRRAVWA